ATIPYRRHLSFWAKSSMFADPLARAIMLSSGAIPVKRNPNNGNGNGVSPQTSLFRESSMVLESGNVICVFPEGTSYTLPSIMQVLSGAAWAAVDYVKWMREKDAKSKELTIVPVGIVYTDKARYQSRVYVKYGKPIMVETYMQELFRTGADVEAETKMAVKQVTAEIERQMRAMTINAPDWDTLHAAQMARDIIYESPANVPLKDWLTVSQSLVDVFTTSSSSPASLDAAKTALTKYYSLLHHTGISHSSLATLLPIDPKPLFTRLLRTVIHIPFAFFSFVIFLPPMLLHVPAYIFGKLAARLLVDEGEVEAEAQFKAIFGGVGLGVGLGTALGVLRKHVHLESIWKFIIQNNTQEGLIENLKRIVTTLGIAYSGIYLLLRWHNALVYGNYKRLKILLSIHKLCLGLIPQRPASSDDLEKYCRLPTPPSNPFIKKKREKEADSPTGGTRNLSPMRNVPTRKLVRPLLEARKQAYSTLEVYLKTRVESAGAATPKA
ncbi:hypothetical protein C0992_001809, partial [Termitomyces sp. T32_za158]